MMPVKRLSLTDFKATMPRGAREKTLKAALEKDGIMGKWADTAWAKKLKVKESRKNFESRFGKGWNHGEMGRHGM